MQNLPSSYGLGSIASGASCPVNICKAFIDSISGQLLFVTVLRVLAVAKTNLQLEGGLLACSLTRMFAVFLVYLPKKTAH